MQVRDYPIHLEIESTNDCNLSCIMCPRRRMTRPVVHMDWNLLRKIVDESRGLVKSSYVHMIGEPLLNPLIEPMVNYVHDAGIRASISTNCMLLSGKMAEDLLWSRLDEITLCLDGTTKETYDKYRKGGDFQLVKNNIDEFIRLRKNIRHHANLFIEVQIILMKETEKEIEEFKREYEEKLGEYGHVKIKEYSTFGGHVEDLNATPTEPRRFRCSKLRTHMAIQSDGDVVICCRDYNKFTVIGSVKDHTLRDLWHSSKYEFYRSQFDQRNWAGNVLCQNC